MLLDYTKFHLGLYLTLLGAIMAFMSSDWGPARGSLPSRLLYVSVVLFALAGVCGGVIGSSAVSAPGYQKLMKVDFIGPGDWGWMHGRDWAHGEHWLFWSGVTLMLIAFLPFVAEGRGSNDEERARRVLLDLESTWDRADYSGAATLWSENGQLAGSIRTVRGRCAIEQELRAAQSEFGSPIKLADLTLTMVRPDTAVAAGRIRSAVREEGFSAILIEKKRDWKLESWIRYS